MRECWYCGCFFLHYSGYYSSIHSGVGVNNTLLILLSFPHMLILSQRTSADINKKLSINQNGYWIQAVGLRKTECAWFFIFSVTLMFSHLDPPPPLVRRSLRVRPNHSQSLQLEKKYHHVRSLVSQGSIGLQLRTWVYTVIRFICTRFGRSSDTISGCVSVWGKVQTLRWHGQVASANDAYKAKLRRQRSGNDGFRQKQYIPVSGRDAPFNQASMALADWLSTILVGVIPLTNTNRLPRQPGEGH